MREWIYCTLHLVGKENLLPNHRHGEYGDGNRTENQRDFARKVFDRQRPCDYPETGFSSWI